LTAPPIPITSSGRPHRVPLIEVPSDSDASMSVNAMISVLPSFQLQRPNNRPVGQCLLEADIAVLMRPLRVCAMSVAPDLSVSR
jgi:hypothetical protein